MSMFTLRDEIVTALETFAPSGVRVLKANEFAQIAEGSEPGLCLVLGPLALQEKAQRDDGVVALMTVTFEVMASLRNASELRRGEGGRTEEAALLNVIVQLQGVHFPQATLPLYLVGVATAQVRAGLSTTIVSFRSEMQVANPGGLP